jgi:hypothetical protein
MAPLPPSSLAARALIARGPNERASSSLIGVSTTRLLSRFGGHTILRLRSQGWCGYGTALLGRLLGPGCDGCDELQALHRIGKASFRERLSCFHREHRSRKLWIFLCRATRGELFVAASTGSLVLSGEPLGFLSPPLHATSLRILIEPPKGDPITDTYVRG